MDIFKCCLDFAGFHIDHRSVEQKRGCGSHLHPVRVVLNERNRFRPDLPASFLPIIVNKLYATVAGNPERIVMFRILAVEGDTDRSRAGSGIQCHSGRHMEPVGEWNLVPACDACLKRPPLPRPIQTFFVLNAEYPAHQLPPFACFSTVTVEIVGDFSGQCECRQEYQDQGLFFHKSPILNNQRLSFLQKNDSLRNTASILSAHLHLHKSGEENDNGVCALIDRRLKLFQIFLCVLVLGDVPTGADSISRTIFRIGEDLPALLDMLYPAVPHHDPVLNEARRCGIKRSEECRIHRFPVIGMDEFEEARMNRVKSVGRGLKYPVGLLGPLELLRGKIRFPASNVAYGLGHRKTVCELALLGFALSQFLLGPPAHQC